MLRCMLGWYAPEVTAVRHLLRAAEHAPSSGRDSGGELALPFPLAAGKVNVRESGCPILRLPRGQTTQQARRKLQPSPPWLLAARAVAVLAVCGTVWLSVRGQHPYRGPTAAVIPVLVAFIVLNFGATVAVRERAIAGVRGITRFSPAEITVMVLAWASVPVLIWGLAAAGVSLAQYPTTVLIVPGLARAAVMTARAG